MRRALLCACSEYRDPAFTALKYPLNDVDQIRQLLEEPELCAFDEVEVLGNPGRGEAHEAVERLTADSAADDFILFYFSGHGKLAQDGSVALVLADTKEHRLLSTGLVDDQLRVLFNASRARQRVIILDCCYSGAVGEEGFKRASGDAVEALAQQVKGTFVLSASTKFQPAMECDEAKGSAFTACLVEGVRTGAAAEQGTGKITLSKLGEYLTREVPRRSNQQPKFWDFGGVGTALFARAPRLYDADWTEQTVKRLRQMMSRDQIDDQLFVDLQQVLRGSRTALPLKMLELIDDLAQRRLKPLTFLRKWQEQQAVRPAVEAPPPAVTEVEVRSAEPPAEEEPASDPRACVEHRPTGAAVAGERSPEPKAPVPPHFGQLAIVGVAAGLLISLFIASGEIHSPNGWLLSWVIFAVAQASMVFVLWRLLTEQSARLGLISASLAAAAVRIAGMAAEIMVAILWLTAILLIALYLQRRQLWMREGGQALQEEGARSASAAATGAVRAPDETAWPTYPHPLQLAPAVLALLLGLWIAQLTEHMEFLFRGDGQIFGTMFALVQASMVFIIWRLLSNQAVRAAMVVVSAAGGWGVLAAIEAEDHILLRTATVPLLWLSAILLAILHLQRRGAVFRQRNGR